MSAKHHLNVAENLTKLLDNQFKIFGFKFGLDPIIGLIPGFGDVVSLILSLYLVWIGFLMKMPAEKITKMISNVILDFIIGIVPIVGDLSDFVYKANTKNLKIIQQHFKNNDVVEGKIIN